MRKPTRWPMAKAFSGEAGRGLKQMNNKVI
jgi:hypothetical protein